MNIALVGEMGSGKDTVAKLLKPYGYNRLSLADPIRKIEKLLSAGEPEDARALLRGISRTLSDYTINAILSGVLQFYTGRKRLQALGTKAVERQPGIWLDHLMRKISPATKVVITDCRRRQELDEFQKQGFLLIYIDVSPETQRKHLVARDSMFNSEDLEHPAESEIKSLRPLCHLVLDNNGELEDLEFQIRSLSENCHHLRREEAGK